MALEKFGKKRLCLNCNTRFYDLKKKENLLRCPRCNQEVNTDDLLSYNNIISSVSQNNKNKDIHYNSNETVSDESTEDVADNESNEIISLEEIEEE